MASSLERFFRYVEYGETFFDCILWRGWRQKTGYGRFRLGGRGSRCQQAHRFMYETFFDKKIKDGYELDHTCEVRNCISPFHLKEVLPDENKRFRYGRRRYMEFGYNYDNDRANAA